MTRKRILEYSARILLIVAGLLCVFSAPAIEAWFPYLIGVLMLYEGGTMIFQAYPAVRSHTGDRVTASDTLTRGFLLLLLGISTLVHQSDSMAFIGVVWGLIGLYKAGNGISHCIAAGFQGRRTILHLIKDGIEIFLSFLLLFSPTTSVGKHIPLLGLQIIVYALFRMNAAAPAEEDKEPSPAEE